MGDRDQRPGRRYVGERAQHAGHRAGTGRGVGLPAAARHVPAGDPGGVLRRELRAGLLPGQPLPGAEVELAQPGVEPQRQPGERGERPGGVPRAGQVAAEQDVRREAGEERRDGRGLGPPDLVERGVELPLDPAVGVVAGAAVAQQDDAAAQGRTAQGATCVRPTARSASRSTNGMTGQSFHSRSRA